jgi:hypothetical protein
MLARGWLVTLIIAASVTAVAQSPSETRSPVLVELFTSEGCSTCPPADQLMLQLEQQQQLDGVPIIVIGEHVDYWDHQGWRDRFSSATATARQQDYKEKLHFREEYTPQAIVNGKYQVVGSDGPALGNAIRTAAGESSGLRLDLHRASPDSFEIAVVNPSRRKVRLVVAIVESGLTTKVGGGENRGKELQHPSVLRRLTTITTSSAESFQGDARVKPEHEWNSDHLKIIALAQDAATGAILNARAANAK